MYAFDIETGKTVNIQNYNMDEPCLYNGYKLYYEKNRTAGSKILAVPETGIDPKYIGSFTDIYNCIGGKVIPFVLKVNSSNERCKDVYEIIERYNNAI